MTGIKTLNMKICSQKTGRKRIKVTRLLCYWLSNGEQSINRYINNTNQAAGTHESFFRDKRVKRTSNNQVLMNRLNLVNKKPNKTVS